jgi:hypothetical protein
LIVKPSNSTISLGVTVFGFAFALVLGATGALRFAMLVCSL